MAVEGIGGTDRIFHDNSGESTYQRIELIRRMEQSMAAQQKKARRSETSSDSAATDIVKSVTKQSGDSPKTSLPEGSSVSEEERANITEMLSNQPKVPPKTLKEVMIPVKGTDFWKDGGYQMYMGGTVRNVNRHIRLVSKAQMSDAAAEAAKEKQEALEEQSQAAAQAQAEVLAGAGQSAQVPENTGNTEVKARPATAGSRTESKSSEDISAEWSASYTEGEDPDLEPIVYGSIDTRA